MATDAMHGLPSYHSIARFVTPCLLYSSVPWSLELSLGPIFQFTAYNLSVFLMTL